MSNIRPNWEAIYRWFNHWLKEPLTEREKILVRVTNHCFQYPQDYERFRDDNT